MNKLLLLFLLVSRSLLFGQTILNSLPLEFETLTEKGQVLSIKDAESDDMYVFASDNKNLSILKYNKSLFLTSQFNDTIKTEAGRNILGYSLAEDKNPILYWFSSTLTNVQVVKYDLNGQKSKSIYHNFPKNHDFTLTSFQNGNVFYVLSKEKAEQHLLLYIFENERCKIKMFDFSPFVFQNATGKRLNLSLVLQNSTQKMEEDNFNPIDTAAAMNKIYIREGHIILTFDYNLKKTHVFDLNIETSEIIEKFFEQPIPKKPAETANSFYLDKKLFQIVVNKEQFLFDVKDFDSESTIKSYSFSKNDTIPFKNSPFFLQVDYAKPKELSSMAKFLKNLSGVNAVVSVMKNNQNTFITFGGVGEYMDYYYENIDPSLDFNTPISYQTNKTIYFETMLNEKFDFIKDRNIEPLAIDNLFYFLHTNKNIIWYDAIKLDQYQILSYYDSASKQFIMRKFTDGFINDGPGNLIRNKQLLSNPAKFGTIKFSGN